MYKHILLDVGDGIATITLNRPDKLNAYTVPMGEEIVEAFDALRDEDSVRAIILTGAGRGFCAGFDLQHQTEQAEGKTGDGPRLGEERLVREFPLTLLRYPKPVIAAINGHAIGVGITMVLPCDIRIAAAGARIGFNFAHTGVLPGLGSTRLLHRLVGPAYARELVLTAEPVLAAQAQSMGLLNRVVQPDALMDTAREMAAAMAACRPDVMAAAKQLLAEGEAEAVAEAMQREQAASAALRRQPSSAPAS